MLNRERMPVSPAIELVMTMAPPSPRSSKAGRAASA